MTKTSSRNPRAATCEDWDDDNETIYKGSTPHANVARKRSQSNDSDSKPLNDKKSHNGSDSGYSSKTGTNESIASSRKKVVNLTVDTTVNLERERQPYSQNMARPTPTRQPSTKTRDNTKEKPQKAQEIRFRHEPHECTTCDHFGYHIEPQPPIPIPQPQSPKTTKKTSTKSTDDTAVRPRSHRGSSTQDARPVSMFVGAPQPHLIYAQEYTHAIVQPPYYQVPTPITPNTHTPTYQYPQSYIPDTPLSTTYANVSHNYFDPHTAYHDLQQPPPHLYGYPQDNGILQGHYNQYQPHSPIPGQTQYVPVLKPIIHKSAQAIEADKRAMPPPSRPVIKKSSTEKSSRRESMRREADERPDFTSKRSSRDMSHPPTAYKGPSGEIYTRPRPSKSYSTGSGIVEVPAKTRRSRHNTDPVNHGDILEQREANAESYMARMSKGPVDELTAEKLKHLSPKPLASDAGTHRSKESSRSKISASAKTTITCDNGIEVLIPQDLEEKINLQVGNLSLTVNGSNQSDERDREQRRIEARQLSDAGRAPSRRSTTSGGTGDHHSVRKESTSKSTHPERSNHSANSSKKSSRAPSSTRASFDYNDYTSRRATFNEYENPEAFYVQR